jgi:hypothetical protein
VGITATILLQHRPLLHERRSLPVVFLLSAFSPSIIVSALSIACAFHGGGDSGEEQRSSGGGVADWWLHLGGYHFLSYLSVLSLVFLSLVLLLAASWHILAQDRHKIRDADPAKRTPLAVNLGTLQRAAVISVSLMAYNAVNVAYVHAAGSEALAVSFGLSSGLLGCLLLFCYILRSESYVIVWCGANKVGQGRFAPFVP